MRGGQGQVLKSPGFHIEDRLKIHPYEQTVFQTSAMVRVRTDQY